MNLTTSSPPSQNLVPEPPHPFRTPAWIDPRLEHQPCQCPKCRPKPKGSVTLVLRVIVLVLGGVVLPLISLILNNKLHVVSLQAVGTAGLIFTVVSCLAHLIFSPMQRDPGAKTLSHHPPRSALFRGLLLWSAVLSTVYWGYLALLFIPLIPLSVVGIAFIGIGLCGLCPYGALFIALRQTIRGVRAMGRPWGRILLAAGILLPVAAGATIGLVNAVQLRKVKAQIQHIGELAPYSVERMTAIQQLVGQEETLVEGYLQDTDHRRRATMADAFLRLTDTTLNEQVVERARERNIQPINPWWFLQGAQPFSTNSDFWRL